MVFHAEAGWGGLPTRVQKTKIYLETDEFASTPPFSKKHLAGVISCITFGGNFSKTIWRELFQKNTFFGGNNFKYTFGGNILAGKF